MKAIKEVAMDRVEVWVTEEYNRGWTTNEKTGEKIRMKKEEYDNHMAEQALLITEAKQELEQEQAEVEKYEELNINQEDGTTERLKRHVLLAPTPPKLVTINCADCNAERIIKVQDVFQVKRCNVCQKKHRNQRRNEIRRMKRQQAKEQANQQTQ